MFAGIDIASERHWLARLDAAGKPIGKPLPITEDREGYDKLLQALGAAPALVVLEATGHCWKNLFAALAAASSRPRPGGAALVAVYCSSKAAAIGLMQRAGLDLIKHGIDVNAIAPGVVDDEHWEHVDAMFARYENLQPGEKKRTVGASVPFGRMARPDEIGGLATFLASQDTDYIVAQCHSVDGGNWMS